jgi:hypothetical protein
VLVETTIGFPVVFWRSLPPQATKTARKLTIDIGRKTEAIIFNIFQELADGHKC